MTPRTDDIQHGCVCSWEDDWVCAVTWACPISEHRSAYWWGWRLRMARRLRPMWRGVRVTTNVLTGRPALCPGDIVIYTADPLLFGGELLIIGVTDDNRLLCEAVHFDEEDEEPPPRAILFPHEVELASKWARAA